MQIIKIWFSCHSSATLKIYSRERRECQAKRNVTQRTISSQKVVTWSISLHPPIHSVSTSHNSQTLLLGSWFTSPIFNSPALIIIPQLFSSIVMYVELFAFRLAPDPLPVSRKPWLHIAWSPGLYLMYSLAGQMAVDASGL